MHYLRGELNVGLLCFLLVRMLILFQYGKVRSVFLEDTRWFGWSRVLFVKDGKIEYHIFVF